MKKTNNLDQIEKFVDILKENKESFDTDDLIENDHITMGDIDNTIKNGISVIIIDEEQSDVVNNYNANMYLKSETRNTCKDIIQKLHTYCSLRNDTERFFIYSSPNTTPIPPEKIGKEWYSFFEINLITGEKEI